MDARRRSPAATRRPTLDSTRPLLDARDSSREASEPFDAPLLDADVAPGPTDGGADAIAPADAIDPRTCAAPGTRCTATEPIRCCSGACITGACDRGLGGGPCVDGT